MTELRVFRNEEIVEGKRLGRHVEHDPASRAYAIPVHDLLDSDLQSVDWTCHAEILQQGDIGACTGFAMGECLSTDPIYSGKALGYEDCLAIYKLATQLDRIPGEYPPDDTGSSGLAAAKAAKKLDFIAAYHHAFSMRAALRALQTGPVITGVSWYDSFDSPNGDGFVAIAPDSSPRGGHEFLVWGVHIVHNDNGSINEQLSFVKCRNSWGPEFADGGNFYMTLSTWRRLLREQGDVTVPVPLSSGT